MLDPNERTVLFEAMRPPDGARLDAAIGTTFTLDLVTLLATPLAFSRFGAVEDEASNDSIELLESIRRYADRVVIFCQAGFIKAPMARQRLLGFLQESVVEVMAPFAGGLFHPKVWVLRFADPEGAVVYRLLVMSRNHTFDRSWDTVFTLDGELTDRKRGFGHNRPLSDFLAALPELAVRGPLPSRVGDMTARARDEIRRVAWQLPEEVEEVRFWPMGISGYTGLPMKEADRAQRLAVISPFLTSGAIERLEAIAPIATLISREESLAAISADSLAEVSECLFFQRSLEPLDEETATEDEGVGAEPPGVGLHAKLYIADEGWNARLWTGSTNATQAGFAINVEFLVELYGKKSRLGIEAVLGEREGTVQLRQLLALFDPAVSGIELDEEREAAAKRLDELRKRIGAMDLRGRVEPADDDVHFTLAIALGKPIACDGVSIRAWPVTLGDAHAALLAPDAADLSFTVTREALTPFLAIELAVADSPLPPARFVINVPLEGLPDDFRDTLLRSALGSQEHVVRYLMFLLADAGLSGYELELRRQRTASAIGSGGVESVPLAEELIRALDRSPDRLDEIFSLVSDLERSEESKRLLPEGFLPLWSAIWDARNKLR